MDPAQQSLADALKASFWVLKWVMVLLVILFLFSNVFIVREQKEEVALLRFGKVKNVYKRGVHFALPYPIDEAVRVPTAQKTVTVDAFWLNLKEEDRAKDLSELRSRDKGLDPAVDGALLTGDRGIMHLLLQVQYRVTGARQFIENVLVDGEQDEQELLRVVLQNATVAAAAQTHSETLWQDARAVAPTIRSHAQAILDRMQTGIRLENVAADRSYYPLQVKDEVLNVSSAEQRKEELIQQALKVRQETLNASAGPAWQTLLAEIEKLDQVDEGTERDAVIESIRHILSEDALGKSRQLIEQARKERDQIIAETQARERTFSILLDEYHLSPELFRQRLLKDMLAKLYEKPRVVKWLLPAGGKQVVLWLNRDPLQTREAQEERATQKAGGKK